MLTEAQAQRYARNLRLEEVGREGQEKLLGSRVLLVGVGGLGSPAGFYLAAAGVGVVGVVDGDVVEVSNLQRQIAHCTADLGRAKPDSARETYQALNPDVEVRTHGERLTGANALRILSDYDFVIDATDSFPSKFLVADACHFARKPYSHAGVLRFQGQTMTVIPGRTTCYRCVFEGPPPAGAAPTCAQAGVLGTVAGLLGVIQATEAIKYVLGVGEFLTDRLLTVDALSMGFRVISVRKNPRCPLCGAAPTITELADAAL